MKLTLPSGREIEYGISHNRADREFVVPATKNHVPYVKQAKARCTRVWVKVDGEEITAQSTCDSRDMFCRRTGRRLAAINLLAKLRKRVCIKGMTLGFLFPKGDRAAVFFAVCPEYKPKEAICQK